MILWVSQNSDPVHCQEVVFLSLSFSLLLDFASSDASGRRPTTTDEDKKIRYFPVCSSAVSPFNSAFLTVVNAVIHVPCSYDSRVRHTISFCTPISNLLLRNSLLIPSINRGANLVAPQVILQAADYNAFPLIIR